MNVHGEGHGPFDEARRRYEGRECVTFLTVGEAVDLEGNKIEVGEGDHLSNKMPLKRKVLPLAKVKRFGVCREPGGGGGGCVRHCLCLLFPSVSYC